MEVLDNTSGCALSGLRGIVEPESDGASREEETLFRAFFNIFSRKHQQDAGFIGLEYRRNGDGWHLSRVDAGREVRNRLGKEVFQEPKEKAPFFSPLLVHQSILMDALAKKNIDHGAICEVLGDTCCSLRVKIGSSNGKKR